MAADAGQVQQAVAAHGSGWTDLEGVSLLL